MDIYQSLMTYLWNLLSNDEELADISVYPIYAPPDSPFPYIVHRIDLRNITDWIPVRAGTYLVDVYSKSPNAEQALAMREKVMELIHDLRFSTNEIDEVWLWRQTDGFIPDDPDIWHYALQFNLRYLKLSDADHILKR